MSSFLDPIVGVVSVLATAYCIGLLCLHFVTPKSDEASKVVLALSYTSLICMMLASASICLTYFQPRLGSLSDCYCHMLWSTSLIGYVLSLYTVKGMYVTRTRILNRGAIFSAPGTTLGVNIVSATMSTTAITCLAMVTFRADGTCHSDPEAKGCLATFDLSVLYIAIAMISLDSALFGSFCYTWYKLLAIFKLTEQDNRIPQDAVKSFMVQFTVTVTALGSCVADSVFHLIWYRSDGSGYTPCMTVYCLDMMVIATCNVLMIAETREVFTKALHFFCGWALNDDKKGLARLESVASRTRSNQSSTTRGQSVTGSRANGSTPTGTETSAHTKWENQNSYSVNRSIQRNEDAGIVMMSPATSEMPTGPENKSTAAVIMERLGGVNEADTMGMDETGLAANMAVEVGQAESAQPVEAL